MGRFNHRPSIKEAAMPLLENIGVMNPVLLIGPFVDENVAASQTDAQLPIAGAGANVGVVMPKAGYVIGLLWTLDAAASAGSLTIGATVDGTEDADTTQTVTTAVEGHDEFMINENAPRFAAGEQLGVEITTDGSWNGTSSDLAVYLIVALEDWDYH
jgi:hypothetical protein